MVLGAHGGSRALLAAIHRVKWEIEAERGMRNWAELMAQLAKTAVAALSKRLVAPAAVARRTMATEASPEDYGYYPDPLEHATGREKKMLLARLAGDDRYEPKVYYRAEASTKQKPNLVPSHYDFRIIGCMCEQDSGHVNFMTIAKGEPKRCECGHWFKGVDADPESI
ncbi:hypothetical protein GCK72_000630 [Caenorhabditis remanei]|uniref:Uncharacterized protein n=5 Tax=Caenorhabditis TaxID=6237 RepID=A0A6A5HR77_CAERE|nr:hypothetical protein GCK72_000630 [Caenorhabditis remanei]KAF1768817.1 hypothetical protein GCK72_000630 [Caenorhabditis remanei]